MQRTAADHMIWCKERALDYVKRAALPAAVASMSSDLRKHPETSEQSSGLMVFGMVQIGNGADAVRRWIEGFQVGKLHLDVELIEARSIASSPVSCRAVHLALRVA